ncbi:MULTISPECIES: PGF-CTERM sorting domain-containing protein [Streptomyces]|uniref:PGF-CTERM sorting domain-containing protein n=1 Tax=Streptomyces TaxID=1883 RepID=UPI0033D9992B
MTTSHSVHSPGFGAVFCVSALLGISVSALPVNSGLLFWRSGAQPAAGAPNQRCRAVARPSAVPSVPTQAM